MVYGLIQDQGLAEYYQIREAQPPSCPVPAQVSDSNYDFYDQPEFLKKISPDGISIRFFLEGLNCTACLWLLERLPSFCPEIDFSRVNMAESTVEVHRKADASVAAIARTLNRLGYRPHALKNDQNSSGFQLKQRRQDLIRIGTAGALTGNIMILAVSLYGGADGTLADQFRWLSGLLAFPVLTYCAWPFYRSAFSSLRARHLNLDVPIVAAIFAGIITSLWGLISSASEVYFDSLSMLVFLLLSSRFLLREIQNRQAGTGNLEDELLLGTVQRVHENARLEKVSSLLLKAGDCIYFDNESLIPADGIIVSGTATIDASVLTGESQPLTLHKGSKVEAGCRSLFGEWCLQVVNPPAQTRIAQILKEAEKSAQDKSQFVRFADTVSNWFITLVFLSAAALFIYFFNTNPQEGMTRALALIIVTCPCVFGIAIPLSMSLAIRAAARKGILIKNGDAIERLWKIKTLYFDKTGTLTTGKMAVVSIQSSHESYLEIALGLEKSQQHPVARSLTQALEKQGVVPREMNSVSALPRGGVQGEIDGFHYSISSLEPSANEDNSDGSFLSSFGLYQDNTLVARFHLADQPRQESLGVLADLRSKSFSTKILSGDQKQVVENCAQCLGFSNDDCYSQISPEGKAEIISSAKESSAMIGDGANDASALAAAGVGIAVCGSLDVSLKAADIYLTRPSLNSLTQIFEMARMTKSAIRRNLIFSASFNLISGALAIFGLMTPLWAAVLMPLSSLTVLLSSLWTGKKILHAGEKP